MVNTYNNNLHKNINIIEKESLKIKTSNNTLLEILTKNTIDKEIILLREKIDQIDDLLISILNWGFEKIILNESQKSIFQKVKLKEIIKIIWNKYKIHNYDLNNYDWKFINLLCKRFEIIYKIWELKKESNIEVIQEERKKKLENKWESQISEKWKHIFNIIHMFSCDQQKKIKNK